LADTTNVQAAFQIADADHNGLIDEDEFWQLVSSCKARGVLEQEDITASLWPEIPKERGGVTLPTWMTFIQHWSTEDQNKAHQDLANLKKAFTAFDLDKDGYLNKEEWLKFVTTNVATDPGQVYDDIIASAGPLAHGVSFADFALFADPESDSDYSAGYDTIGVVQAAHEIITPQEEPTDPTDVPIQPQDKQLDHHQQELEE